MTPRATLAADAPIAAMRIPRFPPILSTSGPLIKKRKRVSDRAGGEDQAEIFVRHERAERVLRDGEVVASHVKERVGHPEREPVDESPAQKPRPMLERIVVEINPDDQREADENNAERHATVRNCSPNLPCGTRKIFVSHKCNLRRFCSCSATRFVRMANFLASASCRRPSDKSGPDGRFTKLISSLTPKTISGDQPFDAEFRFN